MSPEPITEAFSEPATPLRLTLPDPAMEACIDVARPAETRTWPDPATRALSGPFTEAMVISLEPTFIAITEPAIAPVVIEPDPAADSSAAPAVPVRVSPEPAWLTFSRPRTSPIAQPPQPPLPSSSELLRPT